MEAFYQWVRNIIIFLLLISVIYQILPDSEYKKYMKVCAGMMMILIVFLPILKISGADLDMSYFLGLEGLKMEAGGFTNTMQSAENMQFDQINKNYKTQLEKEMCMMFSEGPLYILSAEASIVEDIESEHYGEVTNILVRAGRQKPEEGSKAEISVAPVEAIDISQPQQNAQNGSVPEDAVPADMAGHVEEMRKKLSDYFYVDEAAVQIKVVN